MAKISKKSQLYILYYPDENPPVYKIGSSIKPLGRLTTFKNGHCDGFKHGYSGSIELIAVFFIEYAHKAEIALGKLFGEKRMQREDAFKKFGTTEIYQLTDLDIKKIHRVITAMYMDIV